LPLPLTSITYYGDGQTHTFAVPFPYMLKSDVAVTVNGSTVIPTWTSPNIIQLATNPPAGTPVKIARTTTQNSLFSAQPGALRASDINKGITQSMFLTQELVTDLDESTRLVASVAEAAAASANQAAASASDAATAVQTLSITYGTYVGKQAGVNPYAGPYPTWLYGIGSWPTRGYYDTKVLGNAQMYSGSGSVTLNNPHTYGNLDTASGLSVSTNSNRPAGVNGFTDPSQVSSYDEFGAVALTSQVDSIPVAAIRAGTFTATSFTPATPIVLTNDVRVAVGMWLRSTDPVNYNGQITNFTVDGLGRVTRINVSAWYAVGGYAGTPAGPMCIINPQDKVWPHLNYLYLNAVKTTAVATSGSTVLGGVVDLTGVLPRGTVVLGTNPTTGAVVIAPDTCVTSVDYVNNSISLDKASSYTGSVNLLFSTGSSFNRGASEWDVFNAGPEFTPTFVQDLGDIHTDVDPYKVVNLSVVSQWRPGLIIYGVPGTVLNYVTEVGHGDNSLRLKYPANSGGIRIPLKGINQLDEGGVGLDMVGVANRAQAGFLCRGSFQHSYVSHGATGSAFLCRPDVDAGQPAFGFNVDICINGSPTIPFALTNNGVVLWKVAPDGSMWGKDLNLAAGGKLNMDGALVMDRDDNTSIVTIHGPVTVGGPTLGFFGAAPNVKPTVTGSRASGAALASLISALASLNLLTDSTTA
jgi:hypothetical protein